MRIRLVGAESKTKTRSLPKCAARSAPRAEIQPPEKQQPGVSRRGSADGEFAAGESAVAEISDAPAVPAPGQPRPHFRHEAAQPE